MKKCYENLVITEREQWQEVTIDRWEPARYVDHVCGVPIYHLQIEHYRRPEISGWKKCKHCGCIMYNHGLMGDTKSGHIICPGDWIVKDSKGKFYPEKLIL